jgi:hypothetical protein
VDLSPQIASQVVSQHTAEFASGSRAETFAAVGEAVEIFAAEAGSGCDRIDAERSTGVSFVLGAVSDGSQSAEDIFVRKLGGHWFPRQHGLAPYRFSAFPARHPCGHHSTHRTTAHFYIEPPNEFHGVLGKSAVVRCVCCGCGAWQALVLMLAPTIVCLASLSALRGVRAASRAAPRRWRCAVVRRCRSAACR